MCCHLQDCETKYEKNKQNLERNPKIFMFFVKVMQVAAHYYKDTNVEFSVIINEKLPNKYPIIIFIN